MDSPDEKIFQVSEFNEFIGLYLSQVGEITVEGEISEIRVSQNKWLFLTIKDESASLDVFALVYQISGYSVLEPGMMVYVSGQPRLYQKTARFSLFANRIVPAGEGALRIAFEKLKEKLSLEGLFDEERKRPIPSFPEKIGLITAKNSRAFSDFIKVLNHRLGGLKIYFYPVAVQGKNSVASVTSAFNYFNRRMPDLDALVLIRGGGSLEDLQSFNDEALARAIFSSKIPVVCGVGHEDDVTIADLVADLRASTPSNAAELLVRTKDEILFEVWHNEKIMTTAFEDEIKDLEHNLSRVLIRLKGILDLQFEFLTRGLEKFFSQFAVFSQKIVAEKEEAFFAEKNLERSFNHFFKQRQKEFIALIRYFLSFDTDKVLARGFSLTFGANGRLLRSVGEVKKNSLVTTQLFDGKIGSRVLNIKKYG